MAGARPQIRLAMAVGMILLACDATIAAEPRQQRQGFLTHLSLLEQLTRGAVVQVLDSLAVPPGETVYLLAGGSHEGNVFVSDAIADELARRGCQVRLLDVPSAPPPAAPAGNGQPPPGGAGAGDLAGTGDQAAPGEGGSAAGSGVGSAPADSIAAAADSLGGAFAADTTGTGGSVTGSTSGGGAESPPQEAPPSGASGSPGDSVAAPPEEAATPVRSTPVPRTYPPGKILEFRVLEFGVQYPSVHRRYLFAGSPTVMRLAGVYLQASWIQGPGGDILDIASGQTHHQDVLSGRAVSLAEGASYPFQKPSVPPTRLGRLVEPIAVVGIITSLVYLFYQNQN